jgi:hypothetical protein
MVMPSNGVGVGVAVGLVVQPVRARVNNETSASVFILIRRVYALLRMLVNKEY